MHTLDYRLRINELIKDLEEEALLTKDEHTMLLLESTCVILESAVEMLRNAETDD